MSSRRTSSPERLPLSLVLAWGLPSLGLSSLLFFVQFYFLNFATDELLLPPAVVGALFALGRAWDAVSDPIVGTRSDRTRSPRGRRRPWMLAGVPLLAAFTWMTWVPPSALEGTSLAAWVGVALLGFYTAYTVYAIPYLSLGSELSRDHHDRTRVFGVQSAAFTAGMILAFPAMQYAITAEDGRRAVAGLVAVAVAAASALLLVPPLRVPERPESHGRGGRGGLAAMRDVARSRHARRLLFAQFVQMLGVGVVGILAPYHFQYVLRRPDLLGTLPALFVLCSVASVPMWVLLSRRLGKRDVWTLAMLAGGVAFGLMFFVREGDVALVSVLLPLAGVALGCGGVVGPSLLADVIDADELETGERQEGAYNAAWGFAIKSSNALVILATGVALQLSGFAPNEAQTDTTRLVLRLTLAAPLVMLALAAAVLRGFTLDETEHRRIRGALDARRRTTDGAPAG